MAQSPSLETTTPWALATVDAGGRPTACLEVGGALYRLAPCLTRAGGPAVERTIDLFDDWPRNEPLLAKAAKAVTGNDMIGGTPRRYSPLLYPGKVLCAGANYYDHLKEMGVPDTRKEAQRLFFFFKPSRNAVVGEGATVHMPIDTKMFDWEIELAAVIGKTARNVPIANALAHVAGYTIGIDFSARDHNRAPETFYKLDWVAGKANDTCCPLGPRFVPASTLKDPQNTALKLSVNGEVKQNAPTADMIFSIAEQVSIASKIMTLDPGDVILTGTPAGVGAPKGTFLKAGDKVDAEIENIGRLSVVIQPSK
jgi:2-keto-4-pentenoate hydratase/2-oxohepta-3-ene-1,7-dioic acid hydratase in catechol pathway